ncbi:hypothetical protein LCGC14_2862610 [marine sediment metagenome]|uniref:Uncharacterized protein n=1 Tax=marine sediment metagenome TaxID=412755 RepID=A0A0F9AWD4_9ZZZZ
MQKFELTDRQLIDIQLLHSSSGLNSLPATEEVKAIAHEAQKELARHIKQRGYNYSMRDGSIILDGRDWLPVLKHFGLNKEEK